MPMAAPSSEPMSISLPRMHASAELDLESGVPSCVICTLPLEPTERPRLGPRDPSAPYRLACAHVMHRQCLLRHTRARGSESGLVICPLCRNFTLESNLENDMPPGELFSLSLPEYALFQARAVLVAPDCDGNSGPEDVELVRLTTGLVQALKPWSRPAPPWARWSGVDALFSGLAEHDLERLQVLVSAFAGASVAPALAPIEGGDWECPQPGLDWDVALLRSGESTGLLRDLDLGMLVFQRARERSDERVDLDFRLLVGPTAQLDRVLQEPYPP